MQALLEKEFFFFFSSLIYEAVKIIGDVRRLLIHFLF